MTITCSCALSNSRSCNILSPLVWHFFSQNPPETLRARGASEQRNRLRARRRRASSCHHHKHCSVCERGHGVRLACLSPSHPRSTTVTLVLAFFFFSFSFYSQGSVCGELYSTNFIGRGTIILPPRFTKRCCNKTRRHILKCGNHVCSASSVDRAQKTNTRGTSLVSFVLIHETLQYARGMRCLTLNKFW